MRDYQRSKVYAWERKYVHKFDKTLLSEADVTDLVGFIWANEGRVHPPKVIIESRMKGANANRMRVKFSPRATTMGIVCHEISHSLLNKLGEDYTEDVCHQHDPYFVRKFVDILEKYMKFDPLYLRWSLNEMGVDCK
jgi:hypothetical protein